MRYDIYDLLITLPDPLVPRPLRLEVDERLNGSGEVLTPLDEAQLERGREDLRAGRGRGRRGLLPPRLHEPGARAAGGCWLRERFPGLAVSLSCEVAPEIREYERTSTTAGNAYVQPLAQRYLAALERRLAEAGFEPEPLPDALERRHHDARHRRRFPIRLVESGPAAGVLAAVFYGALIGERDIVSFDMGGTTAKMCLIKDGAAGDVELVRGRSRPPLQARQRPAGAGALDRADRDRRRRRQHRARSTSSGC